MQHTQKVTITCELTALEAASAWLALTFGVRHKDNPVEMNRAIVKLADVIHTALRKANLSLIELADIVERGGSEEEQVGE